MKLRHSSTSPFVRKCMAVAIETGLIERIELIPTNPLDPESDLPRENPLGKVPALITDEGEALYDSRVICEYLDSLHEGPRLFPLEGPARWRVLTRIALADGIKEAAVLRRHEQRRAPEKRSAGWDAWQREKVVRALDALEREAGGFEGVDAALIAVACALGYLDFRFPEEDWRAQRPRLSAWYAEFSQRPSIAQTVPYEAQ